MLGAEPGFCGTFVRGEQFLEEGDLQPGWGVDPGVQRLPRGAHRGRDHFPAGVLQAIGGLQGVVDLEGQADGRAGAPVGVDIETPRRRR